MPFYGTGPILFEDTFAYSDGALATVGTAKWAAGFWTGQPTLRVLSGKAAGPAVAGWCDNYSKTSVSLGSTGIEVIWTNITPQGSTATWVYNHFFGVAGANPSSYWMRWRTSPGAIEVGELIAGAFGAPLVNAVTSPVNGDSIAVQVLPSGLMTLYRKPSGGSWTQIGGSGTDTTRTSGVIALEAHGPNNRWDAVEVRQIPSASRLKRWNGTAWVSANLKKNNGTIWVPATFKKLP